jgi:hypothetical protein
LVEFLKGEVVEEEPVHVQVTIAPPSRAEPKVSLRQSAKVQPAAVKEAPATPATAPPLRVSRKVKPTEVTPPKAAEGPKAISPIPGQRPPSPVAKGCMSNTLTYTVVLNFLREIHSRVSSSAYPNTSQDCTHDIRLEFFTKARRYAVLYYNPYRGSASCRAPKNAKPNNATATPCTAVKCSLSTSVITKIL